MPRKKLLSLPFLAAAAGAVYLFDRLWQRRFLTVRTQDAMLRHPHGALFLGRKIRVQSLLDCTPEQAWEQVQTSGLLLHVTWPVLSFVSSDDRRGLPPIWAQGDTQDINLYLLRFVPLGWHRIHIERIDPEQHVIQSREQGALARTWDHFISLEPAGENQTLYTDEVVIESGSWTGMVAWLASLFYRYRQERWRRLAARLALNEQPMDN